MTVAPNDNQRLILDLTAHIPDVPNPGLVVTCITPLLPPVPRFSPGYMDTTVDPRTDFARYAWGNWAKNNPIPADKSRWAAFGELDQYNQAGLKGILETAAAKSHEPGSVEQKVGDFFLSAMDTATAWQRSS